METIQNYLDQNPFWWLVIASGLTFGVMMAAHYLIEALPAAQRFLVGEDFDD